MQKKSTTKPKSKTKNVDKKLTAAQKAKIITHIKNILEADSHCIMAFKLTEDKKGIRSDSLLQSQNVTPRDMLKTIIKQTKIPVESVIAGLITGAI